MKRYFYEILTIGLMGGSLFFFVECVRSLAQRDYVGAIILMFIGMAIISVGREMARLALVQKD